MPVTSITSDTETLTLTAIGDYPVSVERLWAAWTDPRQLERFWGPPEWPATFTQHDLKPRGRAEYFMTGPAGEKVRGYWIFDDVEPPQRFSLRDGFACDDGSPNTEAPEIRMEIRFEATESGSRFTATSTFANLEAMQKLAAMGMVEGFTAALSQLDGVLTAG